MKKTSIFTRIISLILTVTLLFVSLTACGELDYGIGNNNENNSDGGNQGGTQNKPNGEQGGSGLPDSSGGDSDTGFDHNGPQLVSFDFEAYYTEEFIIGLISEELSLWYDVFSGSVRTESGEVVYGLCFTDYTNAYSDGETIYYSTGFIAYPGDVNADLPSLDESTVITRTGVEEEGFGYLYHFSREEFTSHAVAFNQYLVYGIEGDQLFYTKEDYDSSKIRELDRKGELKQYGSLYNYDEGRYIIDYDVGNFIGVSGVSLSAAIDYSELQAEIDRIIAEQDENFRQIDVQTVASISTEALSAYLLSLQEETFLGYRVDDLIEISESLDPLEYLRITDEGIEVHVAQVPPPTPTAFARWLTGVTSVIVVLASFSLFGVGAPLLAGAVIGGAVEAFMEVVVNNQMLDWRKVAVAAVAGAISVNMGIFGDAIVGGITESVFTLMDGGSIEDAAQTFVIGVKYGIVLGAAFQLAGKVVKSLVNKFKKPNIIIDNISVQNAIDIDGKIANKIDDPLTDATAKQAGQATDDLIRHHIIEGESDVHILTGSKTPGKNEFKGFHVFKGYEELIDFCKKNNKSYKVEWFGSNTTQYPRVTDLDGKAFSFIKNYDGVNCTKKTAHSFFPDSWTDTKILDVADQIAELQGTPNPSDLVGHRIPPVDIIVEDVKIRVVLEVAEETTENGTNKFYKVITSYPIPNGAPIRTEYITYIEEVTEKGINKFYKVKTVYPVAGGDPIITEYIIPIIEKPAP